MKRFIHILTGILFSTSFLFSQNTYTHADSLKGGLRPERTAFDVYYYDINLGVDIDKKTIVGWVGIYFNVVEDGVTRMQIDLYKNFNIMAIKDDLQGNELKYTRDGNAIFVDHTTPFIKGRKEKIMVFYQGTPVESKSPPWESGFVWKKDKNGRPWVGVACQGVGSSVWWPSKDTQSDEADSVRIAITTQQDLTVVCNGNLRSVSPALSGAQTTEWFVSYPVNNYNISLNIGKYVNFNETYKGIETSFDLDYYVLDYNLDKAKQHFKQVVPMMNAFEKKLGPYPFPLDGYALIETSYLGMEHQSGIAYGNKYQKGYNGVERSGLPLGFDFIIIHESGHEYWGNSITTQDIADMWVHEGFCTYSEALYVEEIYGADTALAYCNAWKKLVDNDVPIIADYGVNQEGSGDMYNKAALMLHTLRWLVNDDKKWYELIKNIQKNFRFQIVTSDQIIVYINQQLGKDYTWLFDQYLKNAQPPILHYDLQQKGSNVEVTINWTNVSGAFTLPLNIQLSKTKSKSFQISSTPQKIIIKKNQLKYFKIDEEHAYFLVEE
jgi:aminopeptidase N